MASFIFRKVDSGTDTKQYLVEESRLGKGLGRKTPLTAEQLTTLYKGSPRDWPVGTDRKVPRLMGDR